LGVGIWARNLAQRAATGFSNKATFLRVCQYNCLVGNPEVKRPLGRPRLRWEDIKMDLKEIFWEDVGSGLGQEAGSCLRGNEPSDSTNCALFLN